MITDKEAIKAAKTLHDFCKERDGICSNCPFDLELCDSMVIPPGYWDLDLEKKSEERKELQKMKRVPFDFNKKEDRDALRGRWITDGKDYETMIYDIFVERTSEEWMANGRVANKLFHEYFFLDGEDAGQPVGKLIEVEE